MCKKKDSFSKLGVSPPTQEGLFKGQACVVVATVKGKIVKKRKKTLEASNPPPIHALQKQNPPPDQI